MAPEMKYDGKINYDSRVDVYALGKLMIRVWFLYLNLNYNNNILKVNDKVMIN